MLQRIGPSIHVLLTAGIALGPSLDLHAASFDSPPTPPGSVAAVDSWQSGPVLAPIQDDGPYVLDSRSVPLPNASTSAVLWDVDVQVAITHTRPEDIELFLVAPNGRTVTLSTGNGAGDSTFYTNVGFDDSAPEPITAPGVVHQYQYLVPEGALTSLQGLAVASGQTWKLKVRDRDQTPNLIGGVLESWELTVTTVDAPLPTRYGPSTFQSSPGATIYNNGVTALSDYLLTGGMGSFVAEVEVFVKIQHANPEQLEIRLIGPNGLLPLSLKNGTPGSGAYFGTTFRDGARASNAVDLPTTDAVYTPPGAKPELVPEGALGSLIGHDANGSVGLRILDTNPSGTPGVLLDWSVTIWTYDPPITLGQCIAGTSSNGCQPSLTHQSGTLFISGVDSNRTGLFFYGLTGVHITQWSATSRLCVKTPIQRTGVVNTGGTPPSLNCDGSAALSWSAHLIQSPSAAGNQATSGTVVSAQFWWRDPMGFPKPSQMSNMAQFVIP